MNPKLVRAASTVFRFSTVRFARHFFADLQRTCPAERSLFGYRFPLDLGRTITHQRLYLEGERAIEERFLVRSLLQPGMTVADVGANIGYYALMFRRAVGDSGRVVCLEPERENLRELERLIAANGFSNVHIYSVAGGARTARVGLLAKFNSTVTDDAGSYSVDVLPLDQLSERPFDFLKIDVEGYELEVLKGARSCIRKERPTIFVEVHPKLMGRYGSSPLQVLEYLRGFYDDLTFYSVPSSPSLGAKLGRNFLNRPLIARQEENQARSSDEPFWIVARS